MALIKRDDANGTSSIQGQGHMHTILGPEAEFEGKLVFKGAVRIDGRFKGEIITDDTLVIGDAAHVESELSVGTLIVNGVFHGNVRSTGSVELHKTARVYGNISSPSLTIEKGARFDGTCKMHEIENKPEWDSGVKTRVGVRIMPDIVEAAEL